MDVRHSYDSAADAYAEHLAAEIVHKPLDRHLLNRFAESARGRGLVLDVGCGPGHVTKYLRDQGTDVVGVDISPRIWRSSRFTSGRRLCIVTTSSARQSMSIFVFTW